MPLDRHAEPIAGLQIRTEIDLAGEHIRQTQRQLDPLARLVDGGHQRVLLAVDLAFDHDDRGLLGMRSIAVMNRGAPSIDARGAMSRGRRRSRIRNGERGRRACDRSYRAGRPGARRSIADSIHEPAAASRPSIKWCWNRRPSSCAWERRPLSKSDPSRAPRRPSCGRATSNRRPTPSSKRRGAADEQGDSRNYEQLAHLKDGRY